MLQIRAVLTGPPCGGKSSVIDELKKYNFNIVPEVARTWLGFLNSEELFTNYDRPFIQNLIELNQIKNYVDNPVGIYDRGLPDEIAYRRFYNMGELPKSLINNCNKYRYNKIFHFPFWDEIYQNDNVRKETKEEALAVDKLLLQAYIWMGYEPVIMPKTSIEERVNFILDNI